MIFVDRKGNLLKFFSKMKTKAQILYDAFKVTEKIKYEIETLTHKYSRFFT